MKHPGRRGIVTATSPKQERTLAQDSRRGQRRESIESFVVVFVAFLVWSFEAEGFVIPTGSMAPTLMGRHKEIVCPQCGNVYTVNADSEVDSSGSGASDGYPSHLGHVRELPVRNPRGRRPSVSGDRIYTMKKGLDTAVSAGGWAGRAQAAGRSPSSSCPRSPKSATSNAWSACPARRCGFTRGDLWRSPGEGTEPFQRLRRPIRAPAGDAGDGLR